VAYFFWATLYIHLHRARVKCSNCWADSSLSKPFRFACTNGLFFARSPFPLNVSAKKRLPYTIMCLIMLYKQNDRYRNINDKPLCLANGIWVNAGCRRWTSLRTIGLDRSLNVSRTEMRENLTQHLLAGKGLYISERWKVSASLSALIKCVFQTLKQTPTYRWRRWLAFASKRETWWPYWASRNRAPAIGPKCPADPEPRPLPSFFCLCRSHRLHPVNSDYGSFKTMPSCILCRQQTINRVL